MKMFQIKPGELARVQELEAEGTIRRRLLDLGLVPGTLIANIRRSPLGDPTLYAIRGAMIALRKEEAKLVNVFKEG
ncbi:MAG: FeoA family protein [Peptococcaceae bacterium]